MRSGKWDLIESFNDYHVFQEEIIIPPFHLKNDVELDVHEKELLQNIIDNQEFMINVILKQQKEITLLIESTKPEIIFEPEGVKKSYVHDYMVMGGITLPIIGCAIFLPESLKLIGLALACPLIGKIRLTWKKYRNE